MRRTVDQRDQELVDAVVGGNKPQFAELVRRYEPAARVAAVAIVHDTHLAQDVLQETFLSAYTNLGKLADRSRFGPWVLKIARRQALRALSRRRSNDVAIDVEELQATECNGQLDEDSSELLDAVGKRIAAGESLQQIQATLELPKYRDWARYGEHFDLNIEGAYRELTK